MEEKIKELRAAIEEAAAAVTDQAQLSDFWQKFLSKNGAVAGLTKSLRDVPKEDRPAVGKTINEFKQWAEGQYQALSVQVEQAALAARQRRRNRGHHHAPEGSPERQPASHHSRQERDRRRFRRHGL